MPITAEAVLTGRTEFSQAERGAQGLAAAFQRAAQQGRGLDTILARGGNSADQFNQRFQGVAQNLERFSSSFRKSSLNMTTGFESLDRWSIILDRSSMVAWRFTMAAIPLRQLAAGAAVTAGVFAGLTAKLTVLASEAEAVHSQFENVIGSAKGAGDMMEWLDRQATKLPVQLGEVRRAGLLAEYYGIDPKQVVKPLSDMVAAIHKPGADMEAAVRAINQLTLGYSRRMRDTFAITKEDVSKHASDTVDNLVKAGRKQEIITAAIMAIQEKYGGSSEALMKTLAGQWTNFEDVLTRLGQTVGGHIAPPLGFLMKLLTGVSEKLLAIGDIGPSWLKLRDPILNLVAAFTLLATVLAAVTAGAAGLAMAGLGIAGLVGMLGTMKRYGGLEMLGPLLGGKGGAVPRWAMGDEALKRELALVLNINNARERLAQIDSTRLTVSQRQIDLLTLEGTLLGRSTRSIEERVTWDRAARRGLAAERTGREGARALPYLASAAFAVPEEAHAGLRSWVDQQRALDNTVAAARKTMANEQEVANEAAARAAQYKALRQTTGITKDQMTVFQNQAVLAEGESVAAEGRRAEAEVLMADAAQRRATLMPPVAGVPAMNFQQVMAGRGGLSAFPKTIQADVERAARTQIANWASMMPGQYAQEMVSAGQQGFKVDILQKASGNVLASYQARRANMEMMLKNDLALSNTQKQELTIEIEILKLKEKELEARQKQLADEKLDAEARGRTAEMNLDISEEAAKGQRAVRTPRETVAAGAQRAIGGIGGYLGIDTERFMKEFKAWQPAGEYTAGLPFLAVGAGIKKLGEGISWVGERSRQAGQSLAKYADWFPWLSARLRLAGGAALATGTAFQTAGTAITWAGRAVGGVVVGLGLIIRAAILPMLVMTAVFAALQLALKALSNWWNREAIAAEKAAEKVGRITKALEDLANVGLPAPAPLRERAKTLEQEKEALGKLKETPVTGAEIRERMKAGGVTAEQALGSLLSERGVRADLQGRLMEGMVRYVEGLGPMEAGNIRGRRERDLSEREIAADLYLRSVSGVSGEGVTVRLGGQAALKAAGEKEMTALAGEAAVVSREREAAAKSGIAAAEAEADKLRTLVREAEIADKMGQLGLADQKRQEAARLLGKDRIADQAEMVTQIRQFEEGLKKGEEGAGQLAGAHKAAAENLGEQRAVLVDSTKEAQRYGVASDTLLSIDRQILEELQKELAIATDTEDVRKRIAIAQQNYARDIADSNRALVETYRLWTGIANAIAQAAGVGEAISVAALSAELAQAAWELIDINKLAAPLQKRQELSDLRQKQAEGTISPQERSRLAALEAEGRVAPSEADVRAAQQKEDEAKAARERAKNLPALEAERAAMAPRVELYELQFGPGRRTPEQIKRERELLRQGVKFPTPAEVKRFKEELPGEIQAARNAQAQAERSEAAAAGLRGSKPAAGITAEEQADLNTLLKDANKLGGDQARIQAEIERRTDETNVKAAEYNVKVARAANDQAAEADALEKQIFAQQRLAHNQAGQFAAAIQSMYDMGASQQAIATAETAFNLQLAEQGEKIQELYHQKEALAYRYNSEGLGRQIQYLQAIGGHEAEILKLTQEKAQQDIYIANIMGKTEDSARAIADWYKAQADYAKMAAQATADMHEAMAGLAEAAGDDATARQLRHAVSINALAEAYKKYQEAKDPVDKAAAAAGVFKAITPLAKEERDAEQRTRSLAGQRLSVAKELVDMKIAPRSLFMQVLNENLLLAIRRMAQARKGTDEFYQAQLDYLGLVKQAQGDAMSATDTFIEKMVGAPQEALKQYFSAADMQKYLAGGAMDNARWLLPNPVGMPNVTLMGRYEHSATININWNGFPPEAERAIDDMLNAFLAGLTTTTRQNVGGR